MSKFQNCSLGNSRVFWRRQILSTSLTLILLGSSFHVEAAPAKKSKNSGKKTVGELLSQVSKADRGGSLSNQKKTTTIPQGEIRFQKTKSAYNLDEIKPPRSSEILQPSSSASADMVEYERVLDRQMDELFKLTKKFSDSANRGEYWLRLAELYVEKSMLIDSRAQEDYDRRLKMFNEGQRANKPTLNLKEAHNYNRKAIQLYEWFQKDFPRDPKMAQALYFLGYNYFELGQPDKGAAHYERLNREFPNSPFVGEAKFALGEYYFENDKWSKAYNEYSQVIKDKRHALHQFATYKGAWCLYRLGKFKDGLKYMEYIIRGGRADNQETQAGRKVVNTTKLEAEALRDIVIFYAAVGDPKRAPEYFRNLVGKNEWDYVEKLAYYTLDKGSKDSAEELFRLLIAQNPNSPKAFEYQYQIVQANFYSRNSPRFREALTRWVKDYGVNSSWASANQNKQELMDNSYRLREQTLRNWILQQHQTAQNSRIRSAQAATNEGYKLYLEEFPTAPTTADMHFYHGELLYDMGAYDEAGIQYKWVVDNASQSKFGDRAAQNLLHAVERSVPTDKEMQQRVGNDTKPLPLDAKSERFITAARWYLEKFPYSEKSAEIKFRTGRIFYQHNQFDEAHQIFKEVVQKYPNTKYSEYSANLILDIYNLKKDYVGLEKTGAELLSSPGLAGTKTGEEIREVLEKASFKRAQDLEANKKYGESAAQFEAFARQNTKSNLATSAWFNAAVNYERAGANDRAMGSYKAVLKSSATDAAPLKQKSKKFLAKIYQEAGLFEESSRLYKELAEESPKDPLTPNYIYNAAVMTEALGKNQQALRDYSEFLDKAKRGKERTGVLFTMAQIHRKLNQRSAAIDKYKEYLESNPTDEESIVEAHFHLGQLIRSREEAEEWQKKTVSVQRRLSQRKKGVGAQYAAQIKMAEAQSILQKFRAIRIPANPQRQKAAVNEKLELLNQLTKELSAIVKLDSAEEIVGALELLGEANQHMAQSIVGAPLPKGLNAEEMKQYQEGIQKVAEPFQAKAAESFKSAVERGTELEAYNSAFKNAYDQMNKVDSQNYYSGGEYGSDARYVHWIGL